MRRQVFSTDSLHLHCPLCQPRCCPGFVPGVSAWHTLHVSRPRGCLLHPLRPPVKHTHQRGLPQPRSSIHPPFSALFPSQQRSHPDTVYSLLSFVFIAFFCCCSPIVVSRGSQSVSALCPQDRACNQRSLNSCAMVSEWGDE